MSVDGYAIHAKYFGRNRSSGKYAAGPYGKNRVCEALILRVYSVKHVYSVGHM